MKKVGRQQKEEVLYLNVGKSRLMGRGGCENPIGLSMCDGPIETVEYIS